MEGPAVPAALWPGAILEGKAAVNIRSNTQGGDLVSSIPGCVCRKVKEMGPFSASREMK